MEYLMGSDSTEALKWSIVPWLTLRRSAEAIEFYKRAFSAVEVYRFQASEDSVVARLSVNGAEFWVGDESPEHQNFSPELLGGSTLRIIFTVPDPHAVFNRAIAAGAHEVYPVHEEYGWLVGRVVDPYGHHWEIGHPLAES
jgi:PhnB protein